MQQLIKLIDDTRKENPRVTSEDLVNMIREYLQIAILKSVYQSKYGPDLSFVGGTCLRICYNLKRYSEDLDFTLDGKTTGYDFRSLIHWVQKNLSLRNIEADLTVSADKVMQKAFIRINDALDILGLSRTKGQKLHIKIEVDTNPVSIESGSRESFFVSKYNEIFPILKHDLETLFAGKVLATLCRPYRRGRDFYDLIWYLNRGVKINLAYLNRGLRMAGRSEELANEVLVFKNIEQIVNTLKPDFILADLSRFLEDSKEEAWIKEYPRVFQQLVESRNSA
jgi:predicted nucleotidyltransferase component of viral defense system